MDLRVGDIVSVKHNMKVSCCRERKSMFRNYYVKNGKYTIFSFNSGDERILYLAKNSENPVCRECVVVYTLKNLEEQCLHKQ